MKRALIIVGSIVGLVIVVLLVAPFVIPVESYKPQVLAQIEKATGREARIEGEFGISLLPRVEFTAGEVSLANAPGGKAEEMVRLERLDVVVELLPLLSGDLVVDTFVLQKPVINLEVDAQGRANWDFARAEEGNRAGRTPDVPPERREIGLSGVRLGDVRLVDGTVKYTDGQSGASYTVSDIDVTVSLPSLTSPMMTEGSFDWKDEAVKLKLGVENPQAFLEGKPTDVTLLVTSDPATLDFKGTAAKGQQVTGSGALDLNVPSVRKLAAWAGRPLNVPGEGLGPLHIAGTVTADGPKYSFTGANFRLDQIEAKGDLRFDGSGKRPRLNARLETGMLDLNPYLPPEEPPPARGAQPAPGSGQENDRKAAKEGWSEEPIDLSGLRAADVGAELTVAGLQARKIRIGKSHVVVNLNNGRLVTDLKEMALYNGNGEATLVADATGDTPSFKVATELSGVQAQQALIDLMELDRIEGTLNGTVQLSTRGKSQRAIISALDGKGNVKFTDGAIQGVNIGAMIRNIESAFLDPTAREQQKTDFTELSGSFTISDGIAKNDDLLMLSPLLRVGGSGTVDLPDRTIQYRLEPKVSATSEGQGGAANVAGVMVPVIVSGPWDNLSYRPDLGGAIGEAVKDPSKALEQLRKIAPGTGGSSKESGEGKTLKDAGETLKNLLGR